MEENPPRVSRKDGTRDVSKDGPTGERRCSTVDKGGGGDLGVVGCSGKYCKSCAAGMIADCVALCCCPCALVNFLTLVFVKVPWMIGRRCLGRRRRKKKEQALVEMRRKCKGCRENEGGIVVERDGNLRRRMLEETSLEIATVFGEEVEVAGGGDGGGGGARSEAERVWFELSQVGHLGFGRVSFTGIEPRDNDD